MTMRRLDRKRLFEVEKQGQTVDVSPSVVMKNALVSATQHREGQKLTTDMVFDFGASGAGLLTKALGVGDVVGTSAVSHLCTITDAVFGVVSKIETVTLEAISDGTLTDYDLMFAGDGDLDGHASSGNDGVLGGNATNETAIQTGMGTLGKHTLTSYNAQELKNRFLYLTAGGATGQKATAVVDCSAAVAANVINGVTTLRFTRDNNSAVVNFKANSGVDFNDTTPAGNGNGGTLGTGNTMDDKFKVTQAISLALDECTHFSTDTTSKTASTGGDTTDQVIVTVANVTATSNNQNFLIDDPENLSGIVVNDFSGGIDSGVAITSGKLLIRVTGFLEPADL